MHILPIIAAILLFGMLTGANLFALGACTILLVFQITRFLSDKWSKSVTVERDVSQSEMQIGETMTVALRISNASGYFIPWLFIEDNLPKAATRLPPIALRITGQCVKLYFFKPRQPALMTYRVNALRRGYYQLGPTILETGDLLGLHRNYKIATEPQFILVLPKLIPLNGLDVTSRRPMGELRVSDRAMEDPTQMVGIREYRAGDSLNRIHWKATARTGTLHTRVFQPTSIQGAMMVLDLHRATNPDSNEPIRTDLAITMAASIAHTLYLMGQPFGLVSNGRDAVDRVRELSAEREYADRDSVRSNLEMKTVSTRLRPVVVDAGRGPEHFSEIHRTLARLERTDGLALADLFFEVEGRLPRTLSLLVIVQQVDDAMALALGMLRRRGFSVSVIVNQHPEEGLHDSAAKLITHNLPVFSLPNEESVPRVCTELLL